MWLCLFGSTWQSRSGRHEGRWLGRFSFGSEHSDWVSCSVLAAWFWWTSTNHKHANITKFMRNEIWYSHVKIQSVSTKSFQPHSVCQNTLEKNMLVYPLCLLVDCMKRNLHFKLFFWQTNVCRSLDITEWIHLKGNYNGHTQHLKPRCP